MIQTKKVSLHMETTGPIAQIEIVQNKPETMDQEIQALSFRETESPNHKETQAPSFR